MSRQLRVGPRKETTVKTPIPGVSRFYFYPEVERFSWVRQRRELHVRISEKDGELTIYVRRWNVSVGSLDKWFMRVHSIQEAVRQAIHTQFSILKEVAFNREILLDILSRSGRINPILSGEPTQKQLESANSALMGYVEQLKLVEHPLRIVSRDKLAMAEAALTEILNNPSNDNSKQLRCARNALKHAVAALKRRNSALLLKESPFFKDREELLRGVMLYKFGRQLNSKVIRALREDLVILAALADGSTEEQRTAAADRVRELYDYMREITDDYYEKVKAERDAEEKRLQELLQDTALPANECSRVTAMLDSMPKRIFRRYLLKPAPVTVCSAAKELRRLEHSLRKGDLDSASEASQSAALLLAQRNFELAEILGFKSRKRG